MGAQPLKLETVQDADGGSVVRELGILFQKSSSRWLNTQEVNLILTHAALGVFKPSTQPPSRIPRGGELYLYDRNICKRFRHDGHVWAMRSGGRVLNESHERMRVPGVPGTLLNVYYATSADTHIQRRVFWRVLEPVTQATGVTSQWLDRGRPSHATDMQTRDDLVLVHYLTAADAAASEAERTSRVARRAGFYDTTPAPSSNQSGGSVPASGMPSAGLMHSPSFHSLPAAGVAAASREDGAELEQLGVGVLEYGEVGGNQNVRPQRQKRPRLDPVLAAGVVDLTQVAEGNGDVTMDSGNGGAAGLSGCISPRGGGSMAGGQLPNGLTKPSASGMGTMHRGASFTSMAQDMPARVSQPPLPLPIPLTLPTPGAPATGCMLPGAQLSSPRPQLQPAQALQHTQMPTMPQPMIMQLMPQQHVLPAPAAPMQQPTPPMQPMQQAPMQQQAPSFMQAIQQPVAQLTGFPGTASLPQMVANIEQCIALQPPSNHPVFLPAFVPNIGLVLAAVDPAYVQQLFLPVPQPAMAAAHPQQHVAPPPASCTAQQSTSPAVQERESEGGAGDTLLLLAEAASEVAPKPSGNAPASQQQQQALPQQQAQQSMQLQQPQQQQQQMGAYASLMPGQQSCMPMQAQQLFMMGPGGMMLPMATSVAGGQQSQATGIVWQSMDGQMCLQQDCGTPVVAQPGKMSGASLQHQPMILQQQAMMSMGLSMDGSEGVGRGPVFLQPASSQLPSHGQMLQQPGGPAVIPLSHVPKSVQEFARLGSGMPSQPQVMPAQQQLMQQPLMQSPSEQRQQQQMLALAAQQGQLAPQASQQQQQVKSEHGQAQTGGAPAPAPQQEQEPAGQTQNSMFPGAQQTAGGPQQGGPDTLLHQALTPQAVL